MKLNMHPVLVAALALFASSCSSTTDELAPASRTITLDPSIQQNTRTITDETGQRFTEGDSFSAFVWTWADAQTNTPLPSDFSVLLYNNVQNTFNGKNWEDTPKMLWKDDVARHSFLGVYPYHEISSLTADAYTLDINNQEKSDWMVALNNEGLTMTTNKVALQFNHIMAKLIVKLTFRDQWGTTPNATLMINNVTDKATVDYTQFGALPQPTHQPVVVTPVAIPEGEISDITFPVPVTAAGSRTSQYTSIMVPQSFQEVSITVANAEANANQFYSYSHPEAILLQPGKVTTLTLTVGKDQVTLGDISIKPWENGQEIEGGEAEETPAM